MGSADRLERSQQPHAVFLVDDVAELRDLIRFGVQDATDFEFAGDAADGEEAIASIREIEPDAIFLDISMPGLDGIGALPVIRKLRPDAAIVVLSALPASEWAPKVKAAGADAFIEKGAVSVSNLLDIARRTISRRRVKA